MPTHTMQMHLHTHTQTKHKDAKHYLSGFHQIPSASDCHRPSTQMCGRSALSFLKGIALTWFKPNLLDDTPGADPAWVNNYSEFVIKLTTNFGPHDPVSNAEHQLDNLTMKDSSYINKYIVKFNCLATQVHGYREGALYHMFYNGLPDHIKDKIAHAVWQLLWHLLLVLHWQREEPSVPILLYP
ncbi:hypothetical protein ID866_9012 [Astraeus odoratus]|nr:hypothetical protein ID866_9012 [Astraeus odoratus]